MTDPVTLGVAALTAGVAILAGRYAVPHPPDLDAERWFKVLLATRLRGEVEAGGGDADAWAEAVVRFVPYHPAGRLPERKVVAPEAYSFPDGEALDGERALVEALAATPPERRWVRMYDEDAQARAARLDDPVHLGPDYDPATWLGPGAGWEGVAAWEEVPQRLARRLEARAVLVRGPERGLPDVLGALAAELGDAIEIPWRDVPPAEAASELVDLLADRVRGEADRFVLFGEAEGAHVVARAMVEAPGLRDRTLAVVAVGGVLLGRPGEDGPYGETVVRDWMGRWFSHDHLDTEAAGQTPWFALQWLDRDSEVPGLPDLPLSHARFPRPGGDRSATWGAEPIDLGPLPADPELPVRAVAQALWTTVGCRVLSRR